LLLCGIGGSYLYDLALLLAVCVFRHFCGTHWNHNPAVVVFRGLKQPYVYRFYEAFAQVKAGRPQYLEGLEADMFEAMGLDRPV
jgi:hypothetical protein